MRIIKKYIYEIVIVLLFLSCFMKFGDNNISEEPYPRVDGSTANIPFMSKIRSEFLKEDINVSTNMTNVSTTDYAWRNLIHGKKDLIIAYEPSSETKEIIKNSDTKLIIKSIGVDALVFIVNSDNPINNLTTENVQDIYQDKIKNWSEVGGDDIEIVSFQRPLNSGSQTLFLSKVMKDKLPKEALKEYMPYGMDDLIDVVSNYRNTDNAIGYSVYYYAKKMYGNDDIKIINIDGIEVNDGTIASNEYPFTNEFYVAIREDEKDDSITKKVFDYILSDKGKKALIESGYVPVREIKDKKILWEK